MPTLDKQTFIIDSQGKKVLLDQIPGAVAVRFKPGSRSDSTSLSNETKAILQGGAQHLDFVAHYGLQVYKVQAPAATAPVGAPPLVAPVERAVDTLNQDDLVDFAAPVFRMPGNNDPVYLTNRFIVEFKPEVSQQQIDQLNQANRVTVVTKLNYTTGLGYLLQSPAATGDEGPTVLSQTYMDSGLARYAHPDLIWRRAFRARYSKAVSDSAPTSLPVPSETVVPEPATPARTTSTDKVPGSAAVAVSPAVAVAPRSVPAAEPAAPAAPSPDPTVPSPAWTYEVQQWHLANCGVVSAWNSTMGDPRITVCIADDGVDVTHPELAGRITAQYDFEGNVASGLPQTDDDNHGTCCAGVAVAAGVAARGAAPGCSLMAVRTPAYLGVADEASMFQWIADNNADVLSCSWGPPDNAGPFPQAANVSAAIHYCVERGRGGKGIPIFWAAGNGNELVSDDGYSSNPDVMAVSACTKLETKSYYSDFGPEIFISAPSSGHSANGEPPIFTVDRVGALGYNPGDATLGDVAGDYFAQFGGTSSCAPLAAGIGALLLSTNPNLTVADVREILKQTADKIGPAGDYDANGHSANFGYGRIDADKAVDAAKKWQPGSAPGGGQVPVVPAPSEPSIQGPVVLLVSADAPAFDTNGGDNQFFAVEVAASASLFDRSQHGDERDATNFYATWQDSGFLSGATYTLRADVWDQLQTTGALYYRLISSASNAGWVNAAATTPDSQAANAPFIRIDSPGAVNASVQAPPSVARSAGPPSFNANSGNNPFYAIEVATDPALFNAAVNGGQRRALNFFASWQGAALTSGPQYSLPLTAWNNLKAANRLYYRLISSATQTSWSNSVSTTPDAQALNAPFMTVFDGSASPLASRHSTPPGSSNLNGDGGNGGN